MDLDNINDIEVLRELVKKSSVKIKEDIYATDGSKYLFKKNHWYHMIQDDISITIYSDDCKSECCFYTYDMAKKHLVGGWR